MTALSGKAVTVPEGRLPFKALQQMAASVQDEYAKMLKRMFAEIEKRLQDDLSKGDPLSEDPFKDADDSDDPDFAEDPNAQVEEDEEKEQEEDDEGEDDDSDSSDGVDEEG
jgi:hypothetical protein